MAAPIHVKHYDLPYYLNSLIVLFFMFWLWPSAAHYLTSPHWACRFLEYSSDCSGLERCRFIVAQPIRYDCRWAHWLLFNSTNLCHRFQ